MAAVSSTALLIRTELLYSILFALDMNLLTRKLSQKLTRKLSDVTHIRLEASDGEASQEKRTKQHGQVSDP